ncbi:MAG: type VI secretion system tube protein Hcp [Chloroflexota bacterium]
MDILLLKPGDDDFAGNFSVDSKVEGSTETSFSGCIGITSMRFGIEQQVSNDFSNSARTSGRPHFNDIVLEKRNDQSSLMLYAACLRVIPIGRDNEVTQIFALRSKGRHGEGGTLTHLYTIELTNAIVGSIETRFDDEQGLVDQFTLNFTDIRWEYSSQKDGTIGQFGWSLIKNRLI